MNWNGLTENENAWMTRVQVDLDRINRLLLSATGRLKIHAIGLPMDHEVVQLWGLLIIRCDTDVPYLMIEVGQ